MILGFFSYENLLKSWAQIRNAQNHSYKHYFRHVYDAYEFALDDNLQALSSRLRSGGFKKNHVSRIFSPKSPNSQRPLTLLSIEDQIAYQAIAAGIAEKICEQRRKYEYKVVFSNILAEDRTTFLFENWRHCYEQYQEATSEYVVDGFKWVVTCDLASFYDTISHDIMFSQIPGLKGESDEREYLSTILSGWTFEKKGQARRHGIPQGPIASDLLAEAFMLVLDGELAKDYNAIRYVDDIRLFARSREDAQKVALSLERLLRSLGLVPQPEKFSIKKLTDGSELRKIETSHNYDFIEDPDGGKPKLSIADTHKILRNALEQEDTEKGKAPNPTLLRFSLFAGTPTRTGKTIAIRVADQYPQFAEPALVYLRRFAVDAEILELVRNMILDSAFGYVRMRSWQYLRDKYYTINKRSAARLASLAIDVIKDQKKRELTEVVGAAQFLLVHASTARTRQAKFVFGIKDRFALAIALKDLRSNTLGLADREFSRVHSALPDIGLAVLHCHEQFGAACWSSIKKHRRNVSPYTNGLRRLMGKDLPKNVHDPVAQGIWDLLKVSTKLDSKLLYGKKWQQALRYLIRANIYERRNPGVWHRSVNGLCELTARSLIRVHNESADSRSKIPLMEGGNKKKFIKYGQLLATHRELAKYYPNICTALTQVNQRRNDDVDSHPISERTGRKSKPPIKKGEVKQLADAAQSGLQEIFTTAEALLL